MRTTVFARGARIVVQASALITLTLVGRSAQAGSPDSDPIQSTTELGVTVEPSQIFDAFEESMDFWPSLRKFLVSDNFSVAERQQRVDATAYVKKVQDDIHGRLFSPDDACAQDVVDYVTWGLRRAEFYRQLRQAIDDPRKMVKLRSEFELLSRQSRHDKTPLNVTQAVALMDSAMRRMGVEQSKHDQAMESWRLLAECTLKLNATQVSAIIHQADEDAGKIPSGELVRKIASAADWALIVKSGKSTSQHDFITAWQELHDEPVAEVASSVTQ